jgi:hypothetical protein
MRMPAKIQDEFTNQSKSYTRQRIWQLRKHRDMRCILCGAAAVTSMYCLRHAIIMRERARKSKRCVKRLNSLTYRLSKKTLDTKPAV